MPWKGWLPRRRRKPIFNSRHLSQRLRSNTESSTRPYRQHNPTCAPFLSWRDAHPLHSRRGRDFNEALGGLNEATAVRKHTEGQNAGSQLFLPMAREGALTPVDTDPGEVPDYSFCDVPYHSSSASTSSSSSSTHSRKSRASLLLRVRSRDTWKGGVSEIVSLCDESERRRALRRGGRVATPVSRPIRRAFVEDRVELDEPLVGYQVREGDEGRMQGFVLCTTFTTWMSGDSFCWHGSVEGGGSPKGGSPKKGRGGERGGGSPKGGSPKGAGRKGVSGRSPKGGSPTKGSGSGSGSRRSPPKSKGMGGSSVGSPRALAGRLNACRREGDPLTTGCVWPRVAEISLLGGLGCGGALLTWLLSELQEGRVRAQDGAPYEFVVLDATTNAIPFYERMGFVHVGARARHYTEIKEGGVVASSVGPWVPYVHFEYKVPEGIDPSFMMVLVLEVRDPGECACRVCNPLQLCVYVCVCMCVCVLW